jgi:hypothetical protein
MNRFILSLLSFGVWWFAPASVHAELVPWSYSTEDGTFESTDFTLTVIGGGETLETMAGEFWEINALGSWSYSSTLEDSREGS